MIHASRTKRITMKDVAKQTGLSVSTVSHVINESRFVADGTKERVFAAIRELGYSPNVIARGLKGKGTRTFGVIIPDVRQVFFAETIRAIESRATELGFNVILCDAEDNVTEESIYANTLLSKGVDGLLIAPVNVERSRELLRSLDVPCVQIDRKVEGYEADFVGVNNAEIAEIATTQLIDSGRKAVAFIGYSPSVYTMRERLAGYRAAMAKNNIPEATLVISDYAGGDFRPRVGSWLEDHPKIDAVLSTNDDVCFAVVWSLFSITGRIKRDIRIVTFDANRWHQVVAIPIETICQPTSEIGKAAIDLLVDRCNGKGSRKRKNIICSAKFMKAVSSQLQRRCDM